MKRYVQVPLLFVALLFGAKLVAQEAKPAYAEWPTAAIYALNLKERKLVLDKQVFRVALKASISDASENKMAFSDLEPQYFVAYKLEASTGDIVDIVTLARP
ncbi:MAG: hypothetical protein AB8B48_09330 [Pseudomonadales bacterium]